MAVAFETETKVPSAADLALSAGLIVVAVLSGLFVNEDRPDTIEPSQWWHWLLMVVPPALVAVRRMNAVLVTVLATVAQSAVWISNLPDVLLPMIVILFTAASDAGTRGRNAAIGASVVLTIVTGIGVRIADDVSLYQLPLIALTCGTAIALGLNATRQRQRAQDLASEVTETRLRSEHERVRAVSAERSSIARELHDIIGHTLSVIAVRAESAHRVAKNKPEVAADAVAEIADSSREALTETRRVLAGLRQSSVVDLAPPPDLGATRRLVTELGQAGVDVTLTERGCDTFSPSAVVLGGAHRIVQEALTNAIKHGGSDVVVGVELTCEPTHLGVRVQNTMQPGPGPSDVTTRGSGLVGMAERADVLGGTFEAKADEGAFIVIATLPSNPPLNDRDEEASP